MRALVPIGRVLFGAIFVFSAPGHFTRAMVDYGAAGGAPWPQVLVPFAGLLALLGGLSVILGVWPRVGAWFLIAFLVPVTFVMHDFWTMTGPEAMTQQIMFFKNLSMLGGACLIAYFGGGPFSLGPEERVGYRERTVPEEGRAPRREQITR